MGVFSDSEDADFLESGKTKQLNPCAPVFYPYEGKEITKAQCEKSKNSELNISKEKQMKIVHKKKRIPKKKRSRVSKTFKREKNSLQICDQTMTSIRSTKREVSTRKRLIRCALIIVIVSIVFKVIN